MFKTTPPIKGLLEVCASCWGTGMRDKSRIAADGLTDTWYVKCKACKGRGTLEPRTCDDAG